MRRGVLATVILCAGLGGCFVSNKPFITPETADHPFPAEAVVTATTANLHTRHLEMMGPFYFIDDPVGSHVFLVKKMGDGLYVAQECGQTHCDYSLLAVGEKQVEQYDFADACKDNLAELQKDGLVVAQNDEGDCVVDNFEKLVTIFLTLHERGAKPDEVYTQP